MCSAWDVFPEKIRAGGLTIYDPIAVGSELWIPAPELQTILNRALRGLNLAGLPLRTRSKRVKERVAEALGYPVPKTFARTQPRFLGQCFDTYIQKSNNLQLWNEEFSAMRRYALIQVDDNYLIKSVRVVTGETLALLDTTGTLTQKYQARLEIKSATKELVSARDTDRILSCLGTPLLTKFADTPTDQPTEEGMLPIAEVFDRISPLVGRLVVNPELTKSETEAANSTARSVKRWAMQKPRTMASFPTCGISCLR